jgi:kinesin family protein 3/17
VPAAGSPGRPVSAQKAKVARPGSAAGRPGSKTSAGTARLGGKKDPTDIGTLRDSVAWGQEEAAKNKQSAAFPKARGLVTDAQDPRRRASKQT